MDIRHAVELTSGMLPKHIASFTFVSSKVETNTLVSPWESIAGLDSVKQKLEEHLLWPIIHGRLFSKNGFQHPGGVLLHGPSGSGKSLLARSFARHLKGRANVILVAGPSLLGKYVGSSEQAVRNLFARARAQRPSLIVIEEVEALAPCRGRDNTGTTDRVVNQLLTELDGTEGRTEVYVLAVSSRPDLIDPAVLRPGRIETKIQSSLPITSEVRREIITSIAPPEIIADLALMERLSIDTEGLSAADLRSIMLDAQLEANQSVSDSQYRSTISAEHVLDSLIAYKTSRIVTRRPEKDRQLSRVTFA